MNYCDAVFTTDVRSAMNWLTRRQITKALLWSSGALVSSSVAGPVRAADEGKHGGTLNVVIQPEPPILVSLTHTAGPTTRVSGKVTEGLVTFDLDFNPRPQLATSWQKSEDGLSYRFELRRGVKWHDGRDFTSADVAHSIELLKQHHPRGRGTLASVREVRTPDPHVAEIVLDKPAPYLLAALTASESPIVPRHIYEGTDPLANPNGRAPIGTGPFVFKEWKQGSHIVLERNPNYWDPGKPYLDRIVIRFIADANARAVALETGEIHGGCRNVQPRHCGRDYGIAQRRFADQHVVGRAAAVAAIDAETGRGVALRIEIDDQDALANRSECGPKIDRCGGLADAPLLVGERQDARMARRLERLIPLINLVHHSHTKIPFALAESPSAARLTRVRRSSPVRRSGWRVALAQ